VPIAITLGAADPASVEASARPDCNKWSSLTQPPPTIRVLRRKTGRIEVVNFRRYVLTVMGKEWPSYLPMPVVAAGAVAVKQYAWYHAVYSRRAANGRCFDVRDGTVDQLYKPNRSRVRPDHHDALAMTWGTTLRKHGRFVMTGYRRGGKSRCGRDATGWKLFAKSATRCAEKGWGWQQILRHYYGPGAELVNSGGGGGAGAGVAPASSPSASASIFASAPAPTLAASGTAVSRALIGAAAGSACVAGRTRVDV
jgi:hypothetical protein